jgi:hypothetical protein
MKDATTELRTYYFTILQGIEHDGDPVPVYDTILNDTITPYTRNNPPSKYIILSNQNNVPDMAKCQFGGRHTIQVDSYGVFNTDEGGSMIAEEINNLVCERVLPDTAGSFDLPNFTCVRSRWDLSRNQNDYTKTQNIYRRITIFNHTIVEK